MDVEFLTAEQVASILQVAPKTVKRLGIAAVRIGDGKRPRYRYRQEDVENYIQSHIQINQSGVIGGYRKAPREKRATLSVQGLPTWEDAKRAVGQMIEEAEEDERNYRRIINLPIHSLEGCVKDYLLDSVEKRSKHRYDGIRCNMGRWIIPFFGAMTNINTITSERIDQFIELHRKRGVKNITIWHYVKDLNALFTWAIRKRRMVENPVMHAENRELIRNRKSVKPPLNMMAINKGIEAITGRDRLYADTLRFMGLRKDEANHVRARDVFDYESEMWLQIVYHHSDIKANRVVPIPPLLWASYREQIAAANPDFSPGNRIACLGASNDSNEQTDDETS